MFLVALCVSMYGCATVSPQQQVQAAISLTPEHFASTATIKDDPLDTTATINTYNGFQEKRGLLGIVWNDNFLRAFVDKKTGRTTIQLYQVIYYQGSGWNFFQTINYETPNGPTSKPVTVISRDVDCTGSRYGGCTYNEHLGIELDEAFLRVIAKRYQPGQMAIWQFKLNAKSGQEHKDGMLPAEIVGFLQALDSYRASHPSK
jgi:hypothetical protein